MNENILRCDDCSAPPTPSRAGSFLWCAWLSTINPPMALGANAAQAEENLRDQLVRYFREEAETPPTNPEAAAEEELQRQKSAGLIWVVAPDERRAFEIWRQLSALVVEEALRVWRRAFPLPMDEVDPLATGLRRPGASATRAPYIAGVRTRGVRGYSRRRTLVGQIVEHLPRLDTGNLETLARHAEAMVGGV